MAIGLEPGNHVHYANRCDARMRQGVTRAYDALLDATQCCRLSPAWPRGLLCAASAVHMYGDARPAALLLKQGARHAQPVPGNA